MYDILALIPWSRASFRRLDFKEKTPVNLAGAMIDLELRYICIYKSIMARTRNTIALNYLEKMCIVAHEPQVWDYWDLIPALETISHHIQILLHTLCRDQACEHWLIDSDVFPIQAQAWVESSEGSQRLNMTTEELEETAKSRLHYKNISWLFFARYFQSYKDNLMTGCSIEFIAWGRRLRKLLYLEC